MVHVLKKTHISSFLTLLMSSKSIYFIFTITFLNSLLKRLQEFSTLKQITSLEIELKYIISDYN